MSQAVPPGQQIDSRQLWIQLLAGPVLWTVHFVSSYLVVEAACQLGWSTNRPGFQGLSSVVILLTALAVIATLLFALKSYRAWRTIHADRSLREEFREPERRFEGPVDFMLFSGFLLSALFAVVILMTGLPAFFLQPC